MKIRANVEVDFDFDGYVSELIAAKDIPALENLRRALRYADRQLELSRLGTIHLYRISDGNKLLPVIKVIREVLGYGLIEAKRMATAGVVYYWTEEQREKLMKGFGGIGLNAEYGVGGDPLRFVYRGTNG